MARTCAIEVFPHFRASLAAIRNVLFYFYFIFLHFFILFFLLFSTVQAVRSSLAESGVLATRYVPGRLNGLRA